MPGQLHQLVRQLLEVVRLLASRRVVSLWQSHHIIHHRSTWRVVRFVSHLEKSRVDPFDNDDEPVIKHSSGSR